MLNRFFLPRLSILCAITLLAIGCGDSDTEPNSETEDTSETADVAEDTTETEDIAEVDPCPNAEGCDMTICPGEEAPTEIQTALIEASEGAVICLSAGTFTPESELSLDVNDVTIRGAGMEETILDFSEQLVGANGIYITSNGVSVEDMKVLNTAGDGIRAEGVDRIAFRGVFVHWESEGDTQNGAYGLYPVTCNEVLIDGCKVVGASDAGIYVGQSTQAIVRNSEVYGNVAGIEVENTTDAEVYDNHAHDNAGGVLIFNLPGIPIQDGKRCKVYNNLIENNNAPNFAEEGNVVAMVPSGTGLFVLAADNNEVHNNTIHNNVTLGVVILAYTELLFGEWDDENFDPYAEGNYVHDNDFANNGDDPQGIAKGLPLPVPLPSTAWDGCADAEKDNTDGGLTNCFGNNGDAGYVNFDLCGDFQNMVFDLETVACTHEALSSVELEWDE